MGVVDWAGRTRYREPTLRLGKKRKRHEFKSGPGKYGSESLKILDNLLAELQAHVRQNKDGRDTFPVSTWFLEHAPRIASAVSHNGGFPEVIGLLQQKGMLAKDYVPVVDDKLTPSGGSVLSKTGRVPEELDELVPMMVDICRELGRMPKTCAELRKLGYGNVAVAIAQRFYGLPYVERVMREKGSLDFLEKKKEGGKAKEGAGAEQPSP
ncbi:MAG: hypothetical protein M1511_13760 [Deltaproteobacteria bacterium]|nr:hypothetical protein [Deltaproteobacteria bacterium]